MKSKDKHEFLTGLGKNLAAIRKSKKLTQFMLADVAGVDRMTIALIETAKKSPSLDTIYKLSDALGIDPALLFKGL